MILSENRCPSRIASGTCFVGITRQLPGPCEIEWPVVPKPPRGVLVLGPPLRGPEVVGAIEVEVGAPERVLGNHDRGDHALFVLLYE
jgi:hypothetical protein